MTSVRSGWTDAVVTPPTMIVGLLAVPVAGWWLVGEQSEPNGTDYFVHPLDIAPGVERALGAIVVFAVVLAVAVLWLHARSGLRDRRWLVPIGCAAVAGALCGFSWRVMTSAVVGANIGAGLMVLLGGPLVVLLLCVALWRAISLRRRRAAPP